MELPIENISDIAVYHRHSPNEAPGCLNTNQAEDGVVFPNIEPETFLHCFVGRTSLVEATGLLYDMGPKQVHNALTGSKKLKDEIARLKMINAELQEKADMFDAAVANLTKIKPA